MEPVRKGYKKTELGVIPDDWAVCELKDVVNVIGGGAFKSVDNKTDGIKWLKISNVGINEISWKDESFLPSNFLFDFKSFVLYGGDYVMALTRPILDRRLKIARLGTNDAPAMLNQRVGKLISNQNVDFVYFLFQKHQVITALLESMAGTDPPNLSNKGIYSITVPLPPTLTEQKAIADALSDVDELIASLEKLIAKKKAIKQGAMQALLTPKSHWVKKTIAQIADVGRGRVISHNEINESLDKSYPVYSSQTSNNGVMGYIGTYDFDGEYVTWTTDGVNAGTIFHREGRFNCTNVCGTLKIREGFAKYISMALSNETPKHVSRNLANPKLMNDVMKKIEIVIPPSLKEQQEIANTLTDIEEELLKQQARLSKYQNLKQGMMQELLTGKTRLV